MVALLHILSLCVALAASDDGADPALLAQIRAYEQARIEVIERVRPTVVCMFTKGDRAGGGSGVVIDPEGYGLTNFHVVAGMLEEHVGEGGMSDHEVYPFDVLGLDPTGMTLLVLTLLLSTLTFSGPRTTVLEGAVHLVVFLVYIVLIFWP